MSLRIWSLVAVVWVVMSQAHGYFHYFSVPTVMDRMKELIEVKPEITQEMIPMLMERHPNMPAEILFSRDPKKVMKFLEENSEELRARSDARTLTYAEAMMSRKLKDLNMDADEILKPLIEHYLSINTKDDRIQISTIKQLQKAIQGAGSKKDQKKVIKKLLGDL